MIGGASEPERFRIAVFGNRGYMSIILNGLLETNHRVVAVCANEPLGPKRLLREKVGKFLRLTGIRADRDFFFEDPFNALDEPVRIARTNGIVTLPPAKIRSHVFAETLARAKPDIVIVAGFHRKIPKSVFGLATKAAVNFHPSLLPRHRGGTPNRWIVFAGENRTGVTVHHLSAEFDTGSIIFSREVPVAAEDSWGDVEKRILATLPSVLDRLMELCATNSLDGLPQEEGNASYEPSFRGKHAQADWNDGPETFHRRCLALRPKTGVKTSYGGEPLCLWDTGIGPDALGGVPGEIVSFDKDRKPVVRCGTDKTLTIQRVLCSGKLVSGEQMAHRMKWRVGRCFI